MYSSRTGKLYEVMVGLEVHVALSSLSKLFSASSTGNQRIPNGNVSLFDAAHPGTLPRLNVGAVELGLRAALAFHSSIPRLSSFQRKHYFYADLPHGYQVTQLDAPLAKGGFLVYSGSSRGKTGGAAPLQVIRVSRLQLEMDTGKSVHDQVQGHSFLDFNRAGTPLLEVVTEPDIRSAEDAAACVHALQKTLMFVGVTEGAMESGQLRVDVNVSVRPFTDLGARNPTSVSLEALSGMYKYGALEGMQESAGAIVAEGCKGGRGWGWNFSSPKDAAIAFMGGRLNSATMDLALLDLPHLLSPGTLTFGPRVEIKNLNSVRSVAAAVDAEAMRQVELMERGEAVVGETRTIDGKECGNSLLLRKKEGSGDYRFLWEADVEPILLPSVVMDKLLSTQPPTLFDMHRRLVGHFRLKEEEAAMLCADPALFRAFEIICRSAEGRNEDADKMNGIEKNTNYCFSSGVRGEDAVTAVASHTIPSLARAAFHWLTSELGGKVKGGVGGSVISLLKERPSLPTHLGSLIALINSGHISGKTAKEVLSVVMLRMEGGGSPDPYGIVKEMGLEVLKDVEAIRKMAVRAVNDPRMASARDKWRCVLVF